MAFALIATAAHSGFVALGFAAALAVLAAAVFLAFLHCGFHVLARAASLAIFHVAFVFALAATGGVLGIGIGCGVMAATLAILHIHIGHVVMATGLGWRSRGRVWGGRSRGCVLCPGSQRQREDEDRNKQSEFHKTPLSKL